MGHALAALYEEHHEHVRAFARRLLGDEACAEDLVQETFLALPDALRSYRGESPLRSFVIGVAANHARHHVRSAVRRRSAHARSMDEDLAPPSTPEDRAERRELAESLTRALDRLPPDQRDAIVLCELEERSAAEVAKMVGAKEATIRTRVFHAKKKLRAILFVSMTFTISFAWAAVPSFFQGAPVNAPARVPVNVPPTRTEPLPVETNQPSPPPMPEPPKPLPIPTKTTSPKPSAVVEDHETPLYREAHEAHFAARDPQRALAAWDAYLAAYPNGRFAPEARYNRAICLVRLGRRDEARAALLPIAAGEYRKREAQKLLDALP